MDMISKQNEVRLCGTLAGRPAYSHSSRAQEFYTFPLDVQRLSGNFDRLIICARREQLEAFSAGDFDKLSVSGELRSFNNRHGEGPRLVISVFAKELCPCFQPDSNFISLSGTVCKEPNFRCTPMGRDICDIMLAVNRHYGRSDYLPIICWGKNALTASSLPVGAKITVEGRVQSRNYIKLTETGPVSRTAYEVSVAQLCTETLP